MYKRQVHTWNSPKLWGRYDKEKVSALSYQLDPEEVPDVKIQAVIKYDFDGDKVIDRTEVYAVDEPDNQRGWERFAPHLVKEIGDFQDELKDGTISVTLKVTHGDVETVRMSRTPGELILPYRGLRSSKGSYDES